jgi:hypothetical protein
MLLTAESAVLLLIDLQERLVPEPYRSNTGRPSSSTRR